MEPSGPHWACLPLPYVMNQHLHIYESAESRIILLVILDSLACTMQFVKLFVILFFALVFHFKFVPHTITVVNLNFIVRMLIYF